MASLKLVYQTPESVVFIKEEFGLILAKETDTHTFFSGTKEQIRRLELYMNQNLEI